MTTPTPAAIPRTSRAALESLVSNLAVRLNADDVPDRDALETLAKLTESLARLIQARAADRALAHRVGQRTNTTN
ncbi:hypothetical protein [Streptomyces sp. NPDC055681]